METPTSPLGLPQFEESDDFHYADVNAALLAINNLTVPTVCTAGTRPATNLFVGREIWETDTEKFHRWDGDEWREVSVAITTKPSIPAISNYTKTNEYLTVTKLSLTEALITVRVILTRTGSSQVISTSGHTAIGTLLPAGARLTSDLRFPLILDVGTGSILASGFLNSAGALSVKAPSGGATIAIGDSINLSTSFSGVLA